MDLRKLRMSCDEFRRFKQDSHSVETSQLVHVHFSLYSRILCDVFVASGLVAILLLSYKCRAVIPTNEFMKIFTEECIHVFGILYDVQENVVTHL